MKLILQDGSKRVSFEIPVEFPPKPERPPGVSAIGSEVEYLASVAQAISGWIIDESIVRKMVVITGLLEDGQSTDGDKLDWNKAK